VINLAALKTDICRDLQF